MAYATLTFKHSLIGAVRVAPVGFSWTTLFFGFFPALLRGHWIWALVIAVINVFTFGLAGLVFAFIYNKSYIKYLIGEEYKVTHASQDPKFLAGKLQLALPMEGQ